MAVELQPSVLARTLPEFRRRLAVAERLSPHVHLDLMDGRFVSTRSLGPAGLAKVHWKHRPDVHAMVVNPVAWLATFSALRPRRVYVHCELPEQVLLPTIAFLRSNRIQVGLAINPQTPLRRLEPWKRVAQAILVLGVTPGRYGAPWHPKTVQRVRELRRRWPQLPVVVDGHVDAKRLPLLVGAGVSGAIIGSAVMESSQPELAWKHLKTIARRG